MLTPEFLETQRQKGRSDTVIDRYYSLQGDQKYNNFKKKFTAKYGDTGTGKLLDFYAYGTTSPTERFAPQQDQSEEPLTEMNWSNPADPRNKQFNPIYKWASNIAGDTSEAIQKGASDFRETLYNPRISGAGKAANLVGETGFASAKIFGSVLGNTLSAITPDLLEKGLKSGASRTVKTWGDMLSAITPDAIEDPVKRKTVESVKGIIDYANQLKETNPEAYNAIDSALGIGALVTTLVGAEKTISGTQKLAGAAGKKLGVALDANMAAQQEALSTVPLSTGIEKLAQPKANKKTIFQAAKEGRVIENRAGEPTGITPSAREKEVAAAMQTAGVTEKMSPAKAASTTQKGIAEAGSQIEKEITSKNFAFSDNEASGVLKSALAQAEDNAVITTLSEKKVFEKIGDLWMKKFKAVANTPVDEFVPGTKVKGAGGNRLNAWYKTRIIMDDLAPPKTFTGDTTMNAKVAAFQAYRNAANEFLATSLERQGSAYSPVMRYMTNLYRGLDALETTVPNKLAPTDLQKALGITKKVLIGIGAYEALKKVPVVQNVIPAL